MSVVGPSNYTINLIERCRLIRVEQERRWLEENREAIAQYNRRVAEHGLLSDDAGLL
jgi:post-segregation antitoxin (ccd killing protein)